MRQQLKAIQSELGREMNRRRDRAVSRKDRSRQDAKTARKSPQLKKLERMHPDAAETATLRNWMEIMTDLPWSRFWSTTSICKKAERVLNEDHYGLEKLRIESRSACRAQTQRKPKGPILCLVGPPGVGKTSLDVQSPERSIGSLCDSRSAAFTMKRRFAAIAEPTSAQCREELFRQYSRRARTIR